MELSLQFIRTKLLHKFSSETKEIKAIEEVFQIFNYERERLEEYTQTPKFVSAYTLYYLSTNIAKWQACLDRLPIEIQNIIMSRDIVEIGTGPGTFALAASLSENFTGHWYGVDQSDLMLDQAKSIFDGRGDESQYSFYSKVPRTDITRGSTLLFTHSLNEMSVEKVHGLIERLEPAMVIWIEPGTKDFFNKASELRKFLIKKEFSIITPCLGPKNCPAVQVEGEWCHQILNVSHPSDIERLCQKLSRDRRTMPVSFHVYSKETFDLSDDKESESATIFRMRKTHKHAQDMQVCNRNQELEELEVSFHGLEKSQKKQLSQSLAGQRLDFQVVKELKEKRRVSISSDFS